MSQNAHVFGDHRGPAPFTVDSQNVEHEKHETRGNHATSLNRSTHQERSTNMVHDDGRRYEHGNHPDYCDECREEDLAENHWRAQVDDWSEDYPT
ncbi:MAG: hypothetical protein WC455_25175 [Dehalococcoidia bacterium]